MFSLEDEHFRAFGYHASFLSWVMLAGALGAAWSGYAAIRSGRSLWIAILLTYAAGLLFAVHGFPLNYLRSDMLPVISWADDRLVHHLNPYGTMQVGARVYDFPYLPGMLVAFLPAVAAHVDLRLASLLYIAGLAGLLYAATRIDRRAQVATLLGFFLLCPFLQYRHDLYLAPHWFTLVAAVVLLQWRHDRWSALVWGVSCGVYQLSWVLLPFVLLHGYRRRGAAELLKMILLAGLGALLLVGPFLRVAAHQVAHNTVGQWSRLPHALADPINLSYWVTYAVRPDRLMWVQAAVLAGLFLYCICQKRCQDLADTLRWMCWALAIFIALNVLVDGYFYLTLLLMVMLYVCVANGWWKGDHLPASV